MDSLYEINEELKSSFYYKSKKENYYDLNLKGEGIHSITIDSPTLLNKIIEKQGAWSPKMKIDDEMTQLIKNINVRHDDGFSSATVDRHPDTENLTDRVDKFSH